MLTYSIIDFNSHYSVLPPLARLFYLYTKITCMEPSFWGVIIYTIPVLAVIFLVIKREDTDDRVVEHKMYKNYRKTRMDKPVY